MYKVLITRTAEKQLKKLSLDVQRKIAAIIFSLSVEPYPFGSKRLSGSACSYRIRAGDYRIIYDVYDKEVVVSVLKTGHRKDEYK